MSEKSSKGGVEKRGGLGESGWHSSEEEAVCEGAGVEI